MRASPLALLLLCASCFGAPPTRSPLFDRLAVADTPRIEEATRDCLDKGGWRVDPVGELVAGANTVSAAKGANQTQVYIQAPDVKPRVTGGPDGDDPFWTCLSKALEAPKGEGPRNDDSKKDDSKKESSKE